MVRCLSTKRQSCAFCAAEDCLSRSRYWMAASGDPAAEDRLAMSARLEVAESCDDFRDWDDCEIIDDKAESMEDFRMAGQSSPGWEKEDSLDLGGGMADEGATPGADESVGAELLRI